MFVPPAAKQKSGVADKQSKSNKSQQTAQTTQNANNNQQQRSRVRVGKPPRVHHKKPTQFPTAWFTNTYSRNMESFSRQKGICVFLTTFAESFLVLSETPAGSAILTANPELLVLKAGKSGTNSNWSLGSGGGNLPQQTANTNNSNTLILTYKYLHTVHQFNTQIEIRLTSNNNLSNTTTNPTNSMSNANSTNHVISNISGVGNVLLGFNQNSSAANKTANNNCNDGSFPNLFVLPMKSQVVACKFISSLVFEFFPVLQEFVATMVQHRNFIDKSLSQAEIQKELSTRDCVIFPTNDHCIQLHKLDASAKIRIDFNRFKIVNAETNEPIHRFSDFFLDFLKIPKMALRDIKKILGYDPLALPPWYAPAAGNEEPLLTNPVLQNQQAFVQSLQQNASSPSHSLPLLIPLLNSLRSHTPLTPPPPPNLLIQNNNNSGGGTFSSSTMFTQSTNNVSSMFAMIDEAEEWRQNSLFSALMRILTFHSFETEIHSIAVQCLCILLAHSRDGSRACCSFVFKRLEIVISQQQNGKLTGNLAEGSGMDQSRGGGGGGAKGREKGKSFAVDARDVDAERERDERLWCLLCGVNSLLRLSPSFLETFVRMGGANKVLHFLSTSPYAPATVECVSHDLIEIKSMAVKATKSAGDLLELSQPTPTSSTKQQQKNSRNLDDSDRNSRNSGSLTNLGQSNGQAIAALSAIIESELNNETTTAQNTQQTTPSSFNKTANKNFISSLASSVVASQIVPLSQFHGIIRNSNITTTTPPPSLSTSTSNSNVNSNANAQFSLSSAVLGIPNNVPGNRDSTQQGQTKHLRSHPLYKTKFTLFEILELCTQVPQFLHFCRSPINLVFSELLAVHAHPVLSKDTRYHHTLTKICAQFCRQKNISSRISRAVRIGVGCMPSSLKNNNFFHFSAGGGGDVLLRRISQRLGHAVQTLDSTPQLCDVSTVDISTVISATSLSDLTAVSRMIPAGEVFALLGILLEYVQTCQAEGALLGVSLSSSNCLSNLLEAKMKISNHCAQAITQYLRAVNQDKSGSKSNEPSSSPGFVKRTNSRRTSFADLGNSGPILKKLWGWLLLICRLFAVFSVVESSVKAFPLVKFLTCLWLGNEENVKFVQSLSNFVFLHARFAEDSKKCGRDRELGALRKVLAQHYSNCALLLKRSVLGMGGVIPQQDDDSFEGVPGPLDPSTYLFPKLSDFNITFGDACRPFANILHPRKGFVLRYLRAVQADDLHFKEENLTAFPELVGLSTFLFSLPSLPFAHSRTLIPPHISFHFTSASRLWLTSPGSVGSINLAHRTKLISLHFTCLLAFARHKTHVTSRVFHSLGVVEWLAWLCDLEREVHQRRGMHGSVAKGEGGAATLPHPSLLGPKRVVPFFPARNGEDSVGAGEVQQDGCEAGRHVTQQIEVTPCSKPSDLSLPPKVTGAHHSPKQRPMPSIATDVANSNFPTDMTDLATGGALSPLPWDDDDDANNNLDEEELLVLENQKKPSSEDDAELRLLQQPHDPVLSVISALSIGPASKGNSLLFPKSRSNNDDDNTLQRDILQNLPEDSSTSLSTSFTTTTTATTPTTESGGAEVPGSPHSSSTLDTEDSELDQDISSSSDDDNTPTKNTPVAPIKPALKGLALGGGFGGALGGKPLVPTLNMVPKLLISQKEVPDSARGAPVSMVDTARNDPYTNKDAEESDDDDDDYSDDDDLSPGDSASDSDDDGDLEPRSFSKEDTRNTDDNDDNNNDNDQAGDDSNSGKHNRSKSVDDKAAKRNRKSRRHSKRKQQQAHSHPEGRQHNSKEFKYTPPVDPLTDFYQREREKRVLYADPELHAIVLHLCLRLLISPTTGTLESVYMTTKGDLDVVNILSHHINHRSNIPVVTHLVERTAGNPHERDTYRLFRLLCRQLLDMSIYTSLQRLSAGAYGTVYVCKIESMNMNAAIKQISSVSVTGRNPIAEVFAEVSIMERLRHHEQMCHLFDYGVTKDSFWLVMRQYSFSLRHWRTSSTQTAIPLHRAMPLYLSVFEQVLDAAMFLDTQNIVHFDLKLDNFLCSKLGGSLLTPDLAPGNEIDDLWQHTPRSNQPIFNLCVCDFGTAIMQGHASVESENIPRGTECVRSPEMLIPTRDMEGSAGDMIFAPGAFAANEGVTLGSWEDPLAEEKAAAAQDEESLRERKERWELSKKSDIWSLGCVLYELVTSNYLFVDEQNTFLFVRVARPDQELLPADKTKHLCSPTLEAFLRWVFSRDPFERPNLSQLAHRFQQIRSDIETEVLSLSLPKPSPSLSPSPSHPNSNILLPPPSPQTTSRLSELNARVQAIRGGSGGNSGSFSANNSGGGGVMGRKFVEVLGGKRDWDSGDEEPPKLAAYETQSRPFAVMLGCFPKERAHYRYVVSRVTRHIFLSGIAPVLAPNHLHTHNITHILNCSDTHLSLDGFELMVIATDSQVAAKLPTVVEFIQSAVVSGGRVLVFDAGGNRRACALVLGWLMQQFDVPLLEAYLYLMRRRPVMKISSVMAQTLQFWSQRFRETEPLIAQQRFTRLKLESAKSQDASHTHSIPSFLPTATTTFQCLCGTVCIVYCPPPQPRTHHTSSTSTTTATTTGANNNSAQFVTTTTTAVRNGVSVMSSPLEMHCSVGMCEVFGVGGGGGNETVWLWANKERLFGDFDRTVRLRIEDTFPELVASDDYKAQHKQNDSKWAYFRCKSCGYVTHAALVGLIAGEDSALDVVVAANYVVGSGGRTRNLKSFAFLQGLV